MQLTLEVISPNGELLGSNRRKIVGPEGAQIGRSKESDWVINDQYISRIHARVRCVNGAFYVEGLGRNPLAINDPEATIPNNEPHLLRSGDRFFLDQYEIRAVLAGGATATIPDDPFAPAASAVPSGWSAGMGISDGTAEETSNLDPLALLGGTPQPQIPVAPVNLHQGSVLEESYRPPTPVAPSRPVSTPAIAPGGGGVIPDSWDRSGLTQMGQQSPAPIPAPRRPEAPRPQASSPADILRAPSASDSSIPDTWDKSRFTKVEAPAPTQKLPPLAQMVQDAAHTQNTIPKNPTENARPAPSHTIRRPPDHQPSVSTQALAPQAQISTTATHRALPQPPAPQGGSGSLDLQELLRAAGVPASHMSPEMAAELGQVLRIVVQGLMEVLQSRAEIKSQLRMSMTRMQPTENNPLKFSPNVEAALHTLLVERNRGYLPTIRAFQEALTDIRNHQIAVLQGIRTAFNAMIEQFDPGKIDEELEKQSKRGGLFGGGKARFRELYVEQFQDIANDPDESFKRLFGEFFAQAYEEQMDRLKASGRTIGS